MNLVDKERETWSVWVKGERMIETMEVAVVKCSRPKTPLAAGRHTTVAAHP